MASVTEKFWRKGGHAKAQRSFVTFFILSYILSFKRLLLLTQETKGGDASLSYELRHPASIIAKASLSTFVAGPQCYFACFVDSFELKLKAWKLVEIGNVELNSNCHLKKNEQILNLII